MKLYLKNCHAMLKKFRQWWQPQRDRAQSASPIATTDELPLGLDENPFPAPVVWEITDTIDLHSIPPQQVKAVVAEYLRLAYEHGFRVVRIIHGKGKGVQRANIRRLLSQTDFVSGYADAPDASGWGATIAQLDPPIITPVPNPSERAQQADSASPHGSLE